MKTAEEILKEYGNWNKEGLAEWHKDYIIAAMEKYADFVTKELKSELKECKKILNDPDLLSDYIGGI